jgi:hypothetical protein
MASNGLDISGAEFVGRHRESIIQETAEPEVLLQMLGIGLAIIHHERNPI